MTHDDLFEKADSSYRSAGGSHKDSLRAAIDCVVEECISVAKGCPAWTGTWVAEELMKLKSPKVKPVDPKCDCGGGFDSRKGHGHNQECRAY